MKEKLFAFIDGYTREMKKISDAIHDNPEVGYQEFFAQKILCEALEKEGFTVEKGVGGLETSFRAEYKYGEGGPVIGLLGEYDALAGLGHGCGHHLQTPSAISAVMAIKENIKDKPYTLVIYGTPAEETTGGKIPMANSGCFKELDLVFSNHTGKHSGGNGTSTALQSSVVEWTGTPAHAGTSPERGRSALDAMMLAFHGLECMREHTKQGSRIHYTILEGTGAANIVHPKARARITMRCGDKAYLETMIPRMRKVVEGAAMMTETEVDIKLDPMFFDTIINTTLDKAAAENARLCGAPNPEEHTEQQLLTSSGGATDYGNVSYAAPGILVSTYYCDKPGHTPEHVAEGKTQNAFNYLRNNACIMAGIMYDFLYDDGFRNKVTEEYKTRLQEKTK